MSRYMTTNRTRKVMTLSRRPFLTKVLSSIFTTTSRQSKVKKKCILQIFEHRMFLFRRDRVVAIFLTDNPYQFKNSKQQFQEENIAKLLTKCRPQAKLSDFVDRGYYMKYSDVRMPDAISKWNLMLLEVHRNQRHKDIIVNRQFWEDIGKFLKSKRR